jgi:hypothetical protein
MNILVAGDCGFVVPFVTDGDVLFLKTIIPSRKMTHRYFGDRR